MNQTDLTTARWELKNKPNPYSKESVTLLLELLNKEIGYSSPNIGPVSVPAVPIAPLPDLTGKAKIALCIGHARAGDSGASAWNGTSEESYNNEVAKLIKQKLDALGIESEIINFYPGNGYGSAMTWLAKHLLDNGYTHAFEFHFNSAGPSAKGFEYLYWHKSTRGIVMAKVFQDLHREMFLDKSDRGVEALGDEAHERGVLFTSITHCPSIICEPFFGSNEDDARSYMTSEGKEKLSSFYAKAIKLSIEKLAAL